MSIQTSVCIFCAVFSACLSAAPVDTLTQTCAPCHGAAGVSTQVKTPHLNGQLADNLEDDIRRLASGTRPSSVTDHVPANWTVVDTAAVAQFYASSRAARPPQPTNASLVAKGEALYKRRCADCHPNNGRESKRDAPLLAAQNLDYLKEQTRAFVSGKRQFVFLMDDAFRGLSLADLDSVAHFFASQEQFNH